MSVKKIHDTQTTCKLQTRNVLDLHMQNNTPHLSREMVGREERGKYNYP